MTSDLYVLGIDHGSTYFQHAILLVQDFYGTGNIAITRMFQNVKIYIGDNLDYIQNSECEGSPFMSTNAADPNYGYYFSTWKKGTE